MPLLLLSYFTAKTIYNIPEKEKNTSSILSSRTGKHFLKRPANTYFRPYGPCNFCGNQPTLL